MAFRLPQIEPSALQGVEPPALGMGFDFVSSDPALFTVASLDANQVLNSLTVQSTFARHRLYGRQIHVAIGADPACRIGFEILGPNGSLAGRFIMDYDSLKNSFAPLWGVTVASGGINGGVLYCDGPRSTNYWLYPLEITGAISKVVARYIDSSHVTTFRLPMAIWSSL